ncbi:hypothetical protein [Streptomyces iranensis]|uniref:hypothetical protein n=1 Tax=Streptomyces iranensis TaxID=576784 RepID=UPI0039B75FFD
MTSRPRRREQARQQVDPSALDLLETFEAADRPAFVLGRRLDVLATTISRAA